MPNDRPILPPTQQPDLRHQIIINVLGDGSLQMQAPLHDKILCMGILEMAKVVVAQHQQPKSGIIVPMLVPPKM